MLNFQDKVANNTRLMIELTLPELDAFIPDHETLEVLYNRSEHFHNLKLNASQELYKSSQLIVITIKLIWLNIF